MMDYEPIDPDDELAYRSLSPLAVTGLVMGVLSCAALVEPWLIALPVIAAAISLVAAASIARSPETLTGRNLAVTGLALAVAVFMAVQVSTRVSQHLHQSSAELIADRFVEALAAEDFVSAYELTLGLRYRRPSHDLAELYYESDEQARGQLDKFRSDLAIQTLAGGEAQFLDASSIGVKPGGLETITRRYELPAVEDAPSQRVLLELTRSSPRLSGPRSWWVSKYSIAPISY
ncbi:hypothetical protein [Botrimarina hoheduenensis]|uniref:DUF4190 domain-containing protein n=1 Tax=Botrimarina hoheduenensis TaxID=2528000 RepID=A0A5C5W0E7_9BACT|nr:hypothetical protein [Botrimarina hoheduenensis]TWT43441.1 hypothetical protein Pla111_23920 [Botrimarina hoheduenensis]